MEFTEALKYYDQLIALCNGFERKGKTMPYTSANGHMFSQLNKAGEIGIRLPKEAASIFITKHNSGPFKNYGAVMKDYVIIPKNLYGQTELLVEYFEKSFQYVLSLPPK